MALRNLHALVNPYIAGVVSPNFVGTWLASQGYTMLGDAVITAAIAAGVLTVSALASGTLDVGSLLTDQTFELLPGTVITGFDTGTGGTGTYDVFPPQDVASETMNANGPGTRSSGYTAFPGLQMQVQALSAEDLQHLDGLNQQQTVRAVYMNGQVQGVQRPDVQGGDILQIPTGLTAATGATFDTWLVKQVIEGWDIDGWCKVAVVLQMPTQTQ
jgi:hypothetical protein